MAAAQDLTASVLNRIQRKMSEVFTAGATPILDADPNLNKAATVGALLENTNARMNPITQGRTCVGMDVYHIDGAFTPDDTVLEDFSSEDCDLTPDNYPETVETSYDHNWYEQESIAVSDADCDNLFNNPAAEGSDRVAELIAHQLGLALISLRSKMNASAIAFLAAGATGVNRDLNLPTYITFNGATDEFEVDLDGFFQRPESLTDLDAVRLNNDMPSYFMISGRKNFYNNVVDSRFLRLNDDQRSLARWDTQMNTGPMFFDINRLDSTLTGANTFMIYPGSYAMWNVGLYTPQPRVVDPSTNLFAYSITDPSGLMIRENGVLRPVVYNVHYQYVCKGTDVLGRNIFEHVWQIRFLGGKALAPAATDGHTAILHFTDQFGI
jgi:hypothetical protein